MSDSKSVTPYARRNQLARERGYASYSEQRKVGRKVANRDDLAGLPPRAQQARAAALRAVATARAEGVSVAAAAKREGVSPGVVSWWAADAVTGSGRAVRVTGADRMFRSMYVYSGGRAVSIDVRGSKVASLIGRYHSAVQHYLNTGDEQRLRRLTGVSVGGVELETDLDVINDLARRGSFDFESIYRTVA